MPHSAVALARTPQGWSGTEVDLAEAEDLDTATELVRAETGADDDEEAGAGRLLLLLVEEDDEWFAVVRVPEDPADDPRVYVSDRRVLDTSDLAQRLFEDALPVLPRQEDDEEGSRPDIEPAGDTDLLADLGTTGDRLVELTAEEGLLPADVLAALAEAAGATEAFEAARGA